MTQDLNIFSIKEGYNTTIINSSSERDSSNECSYVTGSTNAGELRDPRDIENTCNQKNGTYSTGVSKQYIYGKEKRLGSRPVTNLKNLNHLISLQHFKMEGSSYKQEP